MITFLVVLTAALAVLAVTRARRRREVLVYAWLMPASTVVQAVIGGITVLTGLLWWTVAIHLLASMTMVWLAVLLYVKIGEPDDTGVPRLRVPKPLRQLTASDSRGARRATRERNAGDRRGSARGRQERRPSRCRGCRSRSPRWCTCTRRCWSPTCRCWSASASALLAVHAPRPVMLRLGVLLALVCAQGLVGTVQFFTGVPAALVAVHVAGAAACTAATAALWASMRERAKPEPVEG